MLGGVFINYRGEDSRSYGVLLHLALSRRFGEELVFLDSESIPAGVDFEERLLRQVREACVLLVVIGPRWLTASDAVGRRRIDSLGDWVRRELVTAFEAGRTVIPVLTDGASIPGESDLPPDIAPLARCQYRRLRQRDATVDLARIVDDLLAIVSAPEGVAPSCRPTNWQRYPVGIDHDHLLGVDATVSMVVESMANPATGWALTLSGEGGRGKTAVAYEAVDRLSASGLFTRVVWTSSKNSVFRPGMVGPVGVVDWLDVVSMMAEQLGCELGPNRRLWEEDLREHVATFGDNEHVLLVVDNLEGIDDAEQVMERVSGLGLGRPHKLLATTRWAVPGNDYESPDVPVPLLSRSHTIALVRMIGAGDSDFATAAEASLAPVFEITEGNPFLVKLIIRRYLRTGRPIEGIVAELTTLRSRPGSVSLGSDVRRYLYEQSLDELAARFDQRAAERLMASFCFAARGEALTEAELRDFSGLAGTPDGGHFRDVLDAACSLALIRPSQHNSRYSVHGLLYEFTCTAAPIGDG